MMLFDSSAIINLCGQRKPDRLVEGYALNFALYEVGNAVWNRLVFTKPSLWRKALPF